MRRAPLPWFYLWLHFAIWSLVAPGCSCNQVDPEFKTAEESASENAAEPDATFEPVAKKAEQQRCPNCGSAELDERGACKKCGGGGASKSEDDEARASGAGKSDTPGASSPSASSGDPSKTGSAASGARSSGASAESDGQSKVVSTIPGGTAEETVSNAKSDGSNPPQNFDDDDPSDAATRRAAQAQTAGNNRAGQLPTGSKDKSKKPAGDPQQAKRTAREKMKAAKAAANSQKHGQAFLEARAGWEAVAPFAQDAECKSLAATLLKLMQQHAQAANAQVETDEFKPLVVE